MISRLRLAPERVQPLELETPLLKDGLGLDSLDCIELLFGIEETFALVFDNEEEEWMQHFSCLASLSQLIVTVKDGQV
jgi:acyl carrier protein